MRYTRVLSGVRDVETETPPQNPENPKTPRIVHGYGKSGVYEKPPREGYA
jgi:hypothetical protein